MKLRNFANYIKEKIHWRIEELSLGLKSLFFLSKVKTLETFTERISFFLTTLRLFLPIPDKYIAKNAFKFAFGINNIDFSNNEFIVKTNDFSFFVPNDKNIWNFLIEMYGCIYILKQYEEPPVTAKEGDVVIDCGACIGLATLFFAQKVGKNGTVVAIEPEKTNFNFLIKTVDNNKDKFPNILPLNCAIYKKDSNLTLFLSKLNIGSHTIYSNNKIEKKLTTNLEEIKAMKIDTIVKNLKLKKVDIIKIDIEGAEIDALLGAESTISFLKPKLIIAIYHNKDDETKIKTLLLKYNPSYNFKVVNRAEKVLFAW